MTTKVDMQLITNELSIKNNQLPPGTFKIDPRVTRNIGVIDDTHRFTQLIVEIVNSMETPFPIDIRADMTAVFDISSLPEDKVDDFLKHQAVAIVLPYIRGMISSATANALMPPIVIPIIDVAELFPD